MATPQLVYDDHNIRVTAISVDHFQVKPSVPLARMPEALAFRVETKGRTYVYSGDTGPSRNLETLARGADVLIAEVVDPPAIAAAMRRSIPNAAPNVLQAISDNMSANHLTPEAIGGLAARAAVKSVVLTHFVPAMEDQPDPLNLTHRVEEPFKGPVRLARDLDRF